MVVINQDTSETIDVPHALAPTLSEGDIFSIQTDSTNKEKCSARLEARLNRLKEKSPQPTSDNFDL